MSGYSRYMQAVKTVSFVECFTVFKENNYMMKM